MLNGLRYHAKNAILPLSIELVPRVTSFSMRMPVPMSARRIGNFKKNESNTAEVEVPNIKDCGGGCVMGSMVQIQKKGTRMSPSPAYTPGLEASAYRPVVMAVRMVDAIAPQFTRSPIGG